MKRFEFSLQQVLDLRRHQRVEAERRLARIKRRINELEREAEQVQNELNAVAREALPDEVRPRDFRRRAAHREGVRARHRRLRERIDALRKRAEEAREELLERRREEESLRTLRDEEKSEHAEDAERTHQKLMDEQALTRFARNQSSNRS